MIVFNNVSKSFKAKTSRKFIANNISLEIDGSTSIALLGRNGAGKSTLLRLISGEIKPDYGQIITKSKISWPVGFSGSFHPDLTGLQNVRFLARVYGVDTEILEEYVKEFSELGNQFYTPLRNYSSGMRSRLAFGVSMGINFDTYLIDEVTSVGDALFKKKSSAILKEKLKKSGAIIVSHSVGILNDLCTKSAVLEEGELTVFDTVADGLNFYNELLNLQTVPKPNLSVQNKLETIRQQLRASREANKKLNERNAILKSKLRQLKQDSSNGDE